MTNEKFRIIGENIHCTRVYKIGGKFVTAAADGGSAAIKYLDAAGKPAVLPVPRAMLESADGQSGKVRHCAAALWQGMHGDDEAARASGCDYLRSLAVRQQRAGAMYLDLNIDEFSTDTDERCQAIAWLVDLLTPVVAIPLCIDSSNTAVLRRGLEKCNRTHGAPMINSVSLERADAVPLAAEYRAAVIASAAGEKELPCDTAGRLANLAVLMKRLRAAGIEDDSVYIDPLVFPVATDSNNARSFIEATQSIRETYGKDIHIVGGFSNVSFGMPCRKLINQVFTWLAVDAGADGGIVDPFQINGAMLDKMDAAAESFKLARALLTGEDQFGGEFITAYRDGRLQD